MLFCIGFRFFVLEYFQFLLDFLDKRTHSIQEIVLKPSLVLEDFFMLGKAVFLIEFI